MWVCLLTWDPLRRVLSFSILSHSRRWNKSIVRRARFSDELVDRRSLLSKVAIATMTMTETVATVLNPQPAIAAVDATTTIQGIRDARNTLTKLLENWEKAVVDCTFADVPRELLETKNKEQLLEKASTFALFDKSVSVTSCKTSNRLVRDYIGSTGKGPVVGLEKKLRQALEFVKDGEDIDMYVQTTENISQALSRAGSLSYAAGVADFASVNNFDVKETPKVLSNESSNLEQARRAIRETVDGLDTILPMLSETY